VSTYTFRIHKFHTENLEDGRVDRDNQYFVEDVEADTVEQALTYLRSKHGDEFQTRIFLRRVN
jgi:hypothetical protein